MANLNELNIKDLQVLVTKPIFLKGRIWDPRLYDEPHVVLIECAKEQYVLEDDKKVVFFAKSGVKFDPFASVTMVGDVPPLNDGDEDDDEDDDDGDDGSNSGNNNGDGEDEKGFKTAEEFATLSKSDQLTYVESIKDTPAELSEEEGEEYEANLFTALTEYSKVATGSKAIALIDEVLALYN